MEDALHSSMFWIVAAGSIAALGGVIIIWNLLVSLRNDIRRAWANIDVVLQQRHDEVGNLVSAVRDYMEYEQNLLKEITEARSRLASAAGVREKAGHDQRLRRSMQNLFATIENYPDVKSNHLVLDLMRRITELENMLADRRELYNSTVTEYNTTATVFPVVLLSSSLGFSEEALFEAEAAARVAPVIKLRS